MAGEARLIAFETWMNAALREGDWLGALNVSATLLDARAVAIVWLDSGRIILNASPDAPSRFLRLCGGLATAHGGGVLEHNEPELGQVAWTRTPADSAPPSADLVFAALCDGPPDHALLREIANVAANGVATKARLASVRATSALKTAAFDQLPFGVVIVDQQMRVAEPNDACRQILARSDGLRVTQDKLLCREKSDQGALHRAVKRALLGDANPSIVKIRRAHGAQPYVVRVVAPRPAAGAEAHCLLMIVDPDEERSPGGDIWRAMFDLTDCELIIAEGLVLGRRINDIACERGVSIETVRTQTKRMFERLNVSSQAEAAVRLSRTAPFRLARGRENDVSLETAAPA